MTTSAVRRPMSASAKKARALNILRVICLVIIVLIVLIPFYISFLYSFKTHSDISLNRLAWPKHPTLENYIRVIRENKYVAIGFKNSLLTTLPTVAILLLCTSMASYILARYNSPFYKVMYSIFISGVLVPFQCIMLPLYMNIYNIGLVSTNLGFILARSGLQVSISVLAITGFVKSIPIDIEEAAAIDGCSPMRTFFSVVFPMMKPTLISVGVLEIMWVWNDYLLPYLVLDQTKYKTIPIHIQYLQGSYGRVDLGATMALIILSLIPIIIFYLSCQKHIIKGVAAGAVKG